MKIKRKISALLAVLCIVTALLPAASATGGEAAPAESDVPAAVSSADPSAVPSADPSAAPSAAPFAEPSVTPSVAPSAVPAETPKKGKNWDELTESFLKMYLPDAEDAAITLGYYNLATGEAHYYNGDEYMDACHMYAVPLNMYFTEELSQGRLDWDSKICGEKYSMILERSIVFSSDARSRYLVSEFDSFRDYRRAICPYMGVNPDKVQDKYYERNFFTARQMIECLKTLYAGQERFPGVLEAMEKAAPGEYFAVGQNSFELAHKYGILEDKDPAKAIYNDSAIVYTEEPIAIVMFSQGLEWPGEALAEYCRLMCDYAQANLKPKPSPTPEPSAKPSAAPAASPTPSRSAEPAQSPSPTPELPVFTVPPEYAEVEFTPYPESMYAPRPDGGSYAPTPVPTVPPTPEPEPPSAEAPAAPVPADAPPAMQSSTYATGREVADFALQYVGYSYAYGEESPENGFDCSGLVYYVYGQFGYAMNRVAAAQASNGVHVELDALEPGDVLCFYNQGSYIGHVGIYIGDGQYVHAESSNTGVVVSPLSARTCKIEARRILG